MAGRRRSARLRRRIAAPLRGVVWPPAQWRSEAHWEYDFRDPTDVSVEQALGIPLHACTLNVIRGERYKYVHFAGLPPLLFDLVQDPQELHNRANDPSCAPVMLEYAQRMLSWRMRHVDQTLTHLTLTAEGCRAAVAALVNY